jgi:hypothetical protein
VPSASSVFLASRTLFWLDATLRTGDVRYFRTQMLVILIVTIVTIVACAILVPTHRLLGAAVALMIAAACRAVVSGMVIGCALRNCKRK